MCAMMLKLRTRETGTFWTCAGATHRELCVSTATVAPPTQQRARTQLKSRAPIRLLSCPSRRPSASQPPSTLASAPRPRSRLAYCSAPLPLSQQARQDERQHRLVCIVAARLRRSRALLLRAEGHSAHPRLDSQPGGIVLQALLPQRADSTPPSLQPARPSEGSNSTSRATLAGISSALLAGARAVRTKAWSCAR